LGLRSTLALRGDIFRRAADGRKESNPLRRRAQGEESPADPAPQRRRHGQYDDNLAVTATADFLACFQRHRNHVKPAQRHVSSQRSGRLLTACTGRPLLGTESAKAFESAAGYR
jgi:hypothetical protein